MKRLAAATGFVLACGLVYPLAAQQPTAFTPDTTTEHKATVQKYCVSCHNERTTSSWLALQVAPSTLLPPDDSAYGFDNLGDALGMSPALLDRFREAANRAGAPAMGDPDTGVSAQTSRIRQGASQGVPCEGLPIGTVG